MFQTTAVGHTAAVQHVNYPVRVIRPVSLCVRHLDCAGCNLLNPLCGEGVAGVLSLRVQQLEVKCETKTKDNVSGSHSCFEQLLL
jgi:hypothetical protein